MGGQLIRAAGNGLLVAWVCTALAGCGSSPTPPSPPPPNQQAPAVTGITPSSGSTLGGVAVTISGTNFAAGAAVTIGGTPATNVAVSGATTITATTPQHAAGAGDVVVTVGSLSGTLPGGFTFTAPAAANAPPAITAIVAQDQRRGSPRNFADLEDLVDVQATVTDAETPVGELTYEWSAPVGAIEGSGAAVRWRAPDRFQTPGTVRVALTVIERYQGVDDRGLPTQAEHRVASGVDITLHDSEKEIIDLGYQFLVDFSQQRPPDVVVRNFTDSCPGKAAERRDVVDNQAARTITEYTVSNSTQVRVGFGEVCPYFASRGRVGDGCAWFPVRWRNVEKADGRTTVTTGFDQVNAVFQGGQWRLCDSDFSGATTFRGQPTDIQFKK